MWLVDRWRRHTRVLSSNDVNGNALNGGFTTASVAVVDGPLLDAPIVSKQFVPPSVAVGETSEMTIQLTNTNQFLSITGAQFIDHYPAGMANPSSGTLVDANTCGGTVTADLMELGSARQRYDSARRLPGCHQSRRQSAESLGQSDRRDPSGSALTGDTAFGGLFVEDASALAAPTVTKNFAPQSIAVGDSSVMTITLTNNDVDGNYRRPVHRSLSRRHGQCVEQRGGQHDGLRRHCHRAAEWPAAHVHQRHRSGWWKLQDRHPCSRHVAGDVVERDCAHDERERASER